MCLELSQVGWTTEVAAVVASQFSSVTHLVEHSDLSTQIFNTSLKLCSIGKLLLRHSSNDRAPWNLVLDDLEDIGRNVLVVAQRIP